MANSLSLAHPDAAIGINAFTNVIFEFDIANVTHEYLLKNHLSIGGTGTIGAAGIETDWFEVDPKVEKSIKKKMHGLLCQIELSGTVFSFGKIDLKFFLIDEKYGTSNTSFDRLEIPAFGFLVGSLKVRGNLVFKGAGHLIKDIRFNREKHGIRSRNQIR